MAVRLREGAVLAAPPERVWALLGDWERQAGWMPDVASVRVLGADRELGARLAVRTRVLGIPLTTDLVEVTRWEPPSRLAIVHAGFVSGAGEWLLREVGPDGRPGGTGSTRFTWLEVLRMPPPVLGELALRAYAPVQRAMLRRSIRNLARLLGVPARPFSEGRP